MIPRTKMQKEVFALSKTLQPLNAAQEATAILHGFNRVGYVYNERIYCSECGKSTKFRKGNYITCPHCGKRIHVCNYNFNPRTQYAYCTLPEVCGSYQVMRNFLFIKHLNARKATTYEHYECSQIWVSPQGAETIVALPRCCYGNQWSASSELEVRKVSTAPYNPYDCCGFVLSGGCIAKKLRQRGLTLRLMHKRMANHGKLARTLLTVPDVEKLLKLGQTELARYVIGCDTKEFRWMYAANICNRHGYTVADPTMWVDLLRLLEYHGMDTHNPQYICPTNLKAAHDLLLHRKERKERKKRTQAQLAKIKEAEQTFAKEKAAYMGISITDGSIVIQPLKSVQEFREEGNAMHHCVFQNEYYTKPDSLILSARMNGKRVETVEVSLNSFAVVQSRGENNSQTAYHKQIIKLISNNINVIKKCAVSAQNKATA